MCKAKQGKVDKQREINGAHDEIALLDQRIGMLNQQVLARTAEICVNPRAMSDIDKLEEVIQTLKKKKKTLMQELDAAKQSKQDRQIKGGSTQLLRGIPSRRILAPGDQAVGQSSEASPHPPQSTSSQADDDSITIDTDAKPIQDD